MKDGAIQNGQVGNHYLLYATANDSSFMIKDFKNAFLLWVSKPGVARVSILVSVALVKKPGIILKSFVGMVALLFKNHSAYKLDGIYFRDNKGRDFGSYAFLWRKIKERIGKDDFVFFQNRSAYGPMRNGWYCIYINVFMKHPHTGICGTTINLKDHSHRSQDVKQHVQTYAFLCRKGSLESIDDVFPGENEKTRICTIINGEIELSQVIMRNGFTISCLEEPEKIVCNNGDVSLPPDYADAKTNPKRKHPFVHKSYFHSRRYMLPFWGAMYNLLFKDRNV
jgi:hypothetical protein